MNQSKASNFIVMLLENPEMDIEKAEKIAQMLQGLAESSPKANNQIYHPALWEKEIDHLLESLEQEAKIVIHEQIANALCSLSKYKKDTATNNFPFEAKNRE